MQHLSAYLGTLMLTLTLFAWVFCFSFIIKTEGVMRTKR